MQNLVNLEGRTIVVTGAGQGIGKAIATLAVELGGNVVALDLNPDALGTAMSALPANRVQQVVGLSLIHI